MRGYKSMSERYKLLCYEIGGVGGSIEARVTPVSNVEIPSPVTPDKVRKTRQILRKDLARLRRLDHILEKMELIVADMEEPWHALYQEDLERAEREEAEARLAKYDWDFIERAFAEETARLRREAKEAGTDGSDKTAKG